MIHFSSSSQPVACTASQRVLLDRPVDYCFVVLVCLRCGDVALCFRAVLCALRRCCIGFVYCWVFEIRVGCSGGNVVRASTSYLSRVGCMYVHCMYVCMLHCM